MSTAIESGSFKHPARRQWRDRLAHFGMTGWLALVVIAFWAAAAIFGPAMLSQRGDFGGGEVFAPMSGAHWFGTDYLGRDMLARVIEGARYTVGVAFVATLLASGTGTLLALLAAASGRWIDSTLSRVLDTLTAIPSKMFALLIVAGFGSSVPMLVMTAAIIYVPGSYRMARALAVNPDVLFLDEPFGALDSITRLQMRSELLRIWRAERKTVLFVTHDIEESVQLADRVVVMSARPGRIRRVVNIDIPHPRDLSSRRYIELRDLIFGEIGLAHQV